MGFIEGLILSFVAGWVNSYLYRKYLRRRNKDWIVFLAVIFLSATWTIEILIYFEIFDMRWLNFLPWVNIPLIDKGKYFLWNSFIVFGLDFTITQQPGMEIIASFLLISYLFWYYFGSKLGKVFHGYRPYQQGHYLIFRSMKKFIKDRKKELEDSK
ncbi:hypothetical protein LCGC14_2292060 [marine sediment metagenome]|uniref:Uncharacterized protein n=1 Tax=marine sediment metagenome TaxID=412755 RepID=A0A0F9FL76_9ZZZZ